MKARKWLEAVDRDVEEAFRRVMFAETGHGKRPQTEVFERDLALLTAFLRLRHSAKHAATLEMLLATPAVFVVGDDLWPEQFELGADECNRIAAYTGKTPEYVRTQFEAIGGKVR